MMSFSDLSAQLNSIGVQHLLLVMDVCYGGLFDGTTDHVKTSFLSLLGGNEQDTAPASELMRRALAAPSRIYITSGDENHQVSDGEKGQHSPFSGRFISVLQANAKSRPYLDMAFLLNGLRSLPREPILLRGPRGSGRRLHLYPEAPISDKLFFPGHGRVKS